MNANAAMLIGTIAAVVIAAQVVEVAWLIKSWSLWSSAAVAVATILVVVVEVLVTCRLMLGGWL